MDLPAIGMPVIMLMVMIMSVGMGVRMAVEYAVMLMSMHMPLILTGLYISDVVSLSATAGVAHIF
jgi:hypothetical protein